MKPPHSLRRPLATLLALAVAASVIFAQQPKVQTPASPAPNAAQDAAAASNATIDTLFAANSYAIYGEMRMVGQYVSSQDFKELIEPLRQPGTMPPELSQLLDFITAHAEPLASSRIAFGAMPVVDGLPEVVAAVELSSAEDAAKIEPQLHQFLNDYYAAHVSVAGATTDTEQPGATRTATLNASSPPRRTAATRQRAQQTQATQPAQTVRAGEKTELKATAPVFIKRAGSLVVMADKPFTFRRLRGAAGAVMLADEPGFQAARSRLAADTLFLYFNTTRMSSYTKRQMEEMERRQKQMEAEAEAARNKGEDYNQTIRSRTGGTSRIVVSNSNMNSGAVVSPEATVSNANVSVVRPSDNTNRSGASRKTDDEPSPDVEEISTQDAFEGMTPEERARAQAEIAKEKEAEEKRRAAPGYEEEQKRLAQQREFENQLGQVIFSGDPAHGAWAESIGVGASLQGDQLVVRSLFYSDSDASPLRPIPFIPILLSGPQITTEAASVVPADADIFVSASLDLPQMYDYVASVFKLFDMAAAATGEQNKQGLFESQISAFEQQSKFRIKEDLLATLGNEIAVVVPGSYLGVSRPRKATKSDAANATSGEQGKTDDASAASSPVFIISLTDKKALEEMLPRVLEAVGLKGATEQQLIEKHGDVDVIAFTNGAAAIIDHFLVVSPDAATARWVADAYNRRETLGNSEEFRRAAGWQERQLLGHVYVSNALLKEMFADVHQSAEDVDDPALRAYLVRLDPNPGAVTHSLTKDGSSLFHELHVPKNLLALWSASSIVAEKTAERRRNEQQARFAAQVIAHKESEYKQNNGRYATLEELKATPTATVGMSSFSFYKVEGYEIKLSVSGDKFEATVTPTNYPKQGRRSFYIDQTNTMRGGDLGGKAATAESEVVSN
ncbi:MAG: hypothetical protein ACJ741_16195 [Pyrinomonadaceae bacterium]